MDTPGFDFVKTTTDLVDVLVTGDKVETFKRLLNEENMDYTVMIEDVEEMVTEEYISQEVERRLKSRIQDYASGRLSFTYYPSYNEASETEYSLFPFLFLFCFFKSIYIIVGQKIDRKWYRSVMLKLQVNEYLTYLTKTYSNVASLISIGNSYEGRAMKVLKLSTGGKNKPAIFIDGGIHAREWIAPATVLYMVDLMLSSHKDLLNEVDWYVLPVLNPDGYEFTHTKSAVIKINRYKFDYIFSLNAFDAAIKIIVRIKQGEMDNEIFALNTYERKKYGKFFLERKFMIGNLYPH